jgi:hypothetical protein
MKKENESNEDKNGQTKKPEMLKKTSLLTIMAIMKAAKKKRQGFKVKEIRQ